MERYGDMKNAEGYPDPTAGSVLRSVSPSIRRGDIYYIAVPYSTGHEMEKDRPGIIVSCDALNRTSPCVNVVMCSASGKREDLPEHITIRSTPVKSTAMCQHIYTVDKSRIGKKMGHITSAELEQVDIGIISALSLDFSENGGRAEQETTERAESGATDPAFQEDLRRTQIELDTYKRLYENLLDRVAVRANA